MHSGDHIPIFYDLIFAEEEVVKDALDLQKGVKKTKKSPTVLQKAMHTLYCGLMAFKNEQKTAKKKLTRISKTHKNMGLVQIAKSVYKKSLQSVQKWAKML